jgi:predicted Zn-dependent protease
MRCSLNAALFAVFTSLTLLACASSALPQFKPNRSDQDLNAIGHRNIGGEVNFFSRERELVLGKQLAQEVERSSKMIDDPVVSEYLNRLAQNIAKNSDAKLPVNVRIIDSNEINAFTLPGGYQYVNRALILAANSEAELAGLLAYGIAHTALRTGTRQATKGELIQLSSTPAMIFIPYSMAGYTMYQGLNLAIPLTFLKFSRESVSAADFYAVQYLYKAGYDAEAYPQLLERALQQPPKSQNIPKAFGTHPPLPERLKVIHEEIARLLPPRSDEIASSPDFEAVKERLRAWQPQTPSAPGANPERPILRKPGETTKPLEPPKASS